LLLLDRQLCCDLAGPGLDQTCVGGPFVPLEGEDLGVRLQRRPLLSEARPLAGLLLAETLQLGNQVVGDFLYPGGVCDTNAESVDIPGLEQHHGRLRVALHIELDGSFHRTDPDGLDIRSEVGDPLLPLGHPGREVLHPVFGESDLPVGVGESRLRCRQVFGQRLQTGARVEDQIGEIRPIGAHLPHLTAQPLHFRADPAEVVVETGNCRSSGTDHHARHDDRDRGNAPHYQSRRKPHMPMALPKNPAATPNTTMTMPH